MASTLKNGIKRGVDKLRTYYSEFVRYCLRNYIRSLEEGKGGQPIFRTDAERENWSACHHVFNACSKDDQDVIVELYSPGDTIPDKIYQMARARRESQGRIWSLVTEIEQKVAQRRGLV